MKSAFIKQIPLLAILSVGVFWAGGVAAAEETQAKTAIPATAEGIWKAIDQHIAELRGAIATGKLSGVHVHAYAVRDLIHALPTRSSNLTVDALAKVKQQTQFVDTLAERLDQTGDANDKPGTQANLQKLEGVLKLLHVQYASAK